MQNVPLMFLVFLKRSMSFHFWCFLLVLCTVHWRRPSCLSMLFFGTLSFVRGTPPFLLCFSLLSSLQLFVKPPQITTLPSCFSFSLGCFCLPPPIQYYRPLSIVLQAHCLLDLVPWIYLLPLLWIHTGFKSYLAGLFFPWFSSLVFVLNRLKIPCSFLWVYSLQWN